MKTSKITYTMHNEVNIFHGVSNYLLAAAIVTIFLKVMVMI